MHLYVHAISKTKQMKLVIALFWFTSCFPLLAQRPEIGIVLDLENDSLLSASGYHYVEVAISKYFSPKNVSDDAFKVNLQRIKRMKMKLYACNVFIPAEMKLVGPSVNEASILAYTDIVFQRCVAAGVGLIIWGSGGARRVPDDFDFTKARSQFINIARKVAVQAERYKIVIALESLNSGETNFLNSLEETYEVIQEVNHPNLRLNTDSYHRSKEHELPAAIENTGGYLVNCELAGKDRLAPSETNAGEIPEYLRSLRKINYKGVIFLECKWDNLSTQAAPAYQYLQKQIDEVFGQR